MTLWYLLCLLVILQSCAARLPTNCKPSSYKISLVVPETSLTSTGNTFTGNVDITFQLMQKTSSLQLHSSHDRLTIKTLQLKHIATDTIIPQTSSVDETDVLTITTTQELEVGNYNLQISYDGRLSTTDMNGVYKSSYVDSTGTKKYLVATQFEATHARKGFPCFDEPSYKATFTVDITVPKGFLAMSNTEVISQNAPSLSTVRYQFQPTPVMSTYLVAFVVSDFTCTEVPGSSTKNHVCSRSETVNTRYWAVEVTPKLLNSLNVYTGIPYTESISKLDQVALPDFRSGAMENWGLITYREARLLFDPEEDGTSVKQTIALVIAHELSHSWFGNLVTLAWWSETFLNEGFARYFQNKITHERSIHVVRYFRRHCRY
ncbi:unnamed protein product [Callosobruchus maculatus]|uniref:Uncharacterized protein n=1 Tax=Callosobruchus maculatus TaxID=64391 RepID=A0A653BRE6_CALMS|nr:unnamed protein product [Callosobruchus maculatus]